MGNQNSVSTRGYAYEVIDHVVLSEDCGFQTVVDLTAPASAPASDVNSSVSDIGDIDVFEEELENSLLPLLNPDIREAIRRSLEPPAPVDQALEEAIRRSLEPSAPVDQALEEAIRRSLEPPAPVVEDNSDIREAIRRSLEPVPFPTETRVSRTGIAGTFECGTGGGRNLCLALCIAFFLVCVRLGCIPGEPYYMSTQVLFEDPYVDIIERNGGPVEDVNRQSCEIEAVIEFSERLSLFFNVHVLDAEGQRTVYIARIGNETRRVCHLTLYRGHYTLGQPNFG